MNLEQFYSELESLGRTWQLLGGTKIRSIKDNACPMSAVGSERRGKKFESYAYTMPAKLIGLPVKDAMHVAFAADGSSAFLQIRQRLLEACNLIVPEIAPVEQVNACKLECAI